MIFKRVLAASVSTLLVSTNNPSVVAEEPPSRIIPHASEGKVLATPERWAQEMTKGTGTQSLFFRALLDASDRQELLMSLSQRVLSWEGQFELNGSKRRVLVFVPHPFREGRRVLVLTDESFNVLEWRKIGPGDSVELVNEDHHAVFTQRVMPEALPFMRVQRYRLSDDKIEVYGAPYYEPLELSPETKEERDFYAEVKRSTSEELKENLGLIPPKREVAGRTEISLRLRTAVPWSQATEMEWHLW